MASEQTGFPKKMLTPQFKLLLAGFLISFLASGAGRVPEVGGETGIADLSDINGIWRSQGYGWIWSIEGDEIGQSESVVRGVEVDAGRWAAAVGVVEVAEPQVARTGNVAAGQAPLNVGDVGLEALPIARVDHLLACARDIGQHVRLAADAG